MDEPMDESSDGAHIERMGEEDPPKLSNDTKITSNKLSSMITAITVEEYETQYWPKLEASIDQLLTMKPGEYLPIYYEQMYSCVYKCVCRQFSERLYADLLQKISSHLERVSLELQTYKTHAYIEQFSVSMSQYLQALGGIAPIFNYLNRTYLQTKLRTELDVELKGLFVTYVAERHVPKLIPLLVDANTKPFSVIPATMATLITNLYSLKPEFAQLRPLLFAKYIPAMIPTCSEADLGHYIAEARQMQRDLLTCPDFISGDQGRKRMSEDDVLRGAAPIGVAGGANT